MGTALKRDFALMLSRDPVLQELNRRVVVERGVAAPGYKAPRTHLSFQSVKVIPTYWKTISENLTRTSFSTRVCNCVLRCVRIGIVPSYLIEHGARFTAPQNRLSAVIFSVLLIIETFDYQYLLLLNERNLLRTELLFKVFW